MDVIYTDSALNELGNLSNFTVDVDIAKDMDFEIATSLSDGKIDMSYWFVAGTELGGIVDAMSVVTSANEIRYHGRTWRGLLDSKILEPKKGDDYLVLSGNLTEILNEILNKEGLTMFHVEHSDIMLKDYRVPRYISLYALIMRICDEAKGLRLTLVYNQHTNKVDLSLVSRVDYSQSYAYDNSSFLFEIKNTSRKVNHLICLGAGELKDRLVAHLYADSEDNITSKQSFFGVDEYTATYENVNDEDIESLVNDGTDRFKELLATDTISMDSTDDSIKLVGDIVAGYEHITGLYEKAVINNVIAKISDYDVSFSYEVSENKTAYGVIPDETWEVEMHATSNVLGFIIVGDTMDITSDGVLNDRQDYTNVLNSLAKYEALIV